MDIIQRARFVALLAHRGQVDKNGVDYAEHLLAVAKGARAKAPPRLKVECEQTGWLHDVIEDTPVGHHDLVNLGFGPTVVDAVILLTHDAGRTSHDDYIREIRDAPGRAGEIARIVKEADLEHNADPARTPPGQEAWVAKRYGRGRAVLRGEIP